MYKLFVFHTEQNNMNVDHPCRPLLIRILHLMTPTLRTSNFPSPTILLLLILVILDKTAATTTHTKIGLARRLMLGHIEDELQGYFTFSLFVSVENIRNEHVGFYLHDVSVRFYL